MNIGKAVRTLRVQEQLTQDDLADRAGTTKPSISRIENSEQIPSIDMLERVAAALNVKVYQLCALAEGVRLPIAKATQEEMRIIDHYRVMEPDAKYHLTAVATALAKEDGVES